MGSNRGERGVGRWSIGACVAGLALVACVGQRPADAPTAEVGEYPTRELTLPSGMHVVMEKNADIGVAGVVLVVGTGSADEPAGKAGLAHLTEHVMLRARTEGARSIKERLYDRSTAWNAWTSWDTTTYAAYFPAPSLEAVLRTMSELLAQPLVGLQDAEITREVEIVQNERRLHDENGAHWQSVGWLVGEVFPEDFAYAHPLGGTRESLGSLGRADIEEFVRATYRPSRATLSVSSALDFDAQRALIEAAFGQLPPASRAQQAPAEAAVPPLRDASGAPPVREALVASPTLLVGWPVPSSVTERASVADVLTLMAQDTFVDNSEQREVARASVSHIEGVKGDLFYIEVTLDSGNVPSAEVVGEVVERLGSRLRRGLYERISSSELFERYKRAAAVRQTYAFEQIGTRAAALAESKHFFAASGVLAQRDRQLRALDSATANAYVEKYLSLERARSVVVQPGTGGAGQALAGAAAPSDQNLNLTVPQAEFTQAEVRSWIRPFSADEVRTGTLSNGMSVIVLNRPDFVYHSVLVGFAGGEAATSIPGVSVAEPWSLLRDEWELSVQGLTVERYHSADATVEMVRSTGSNLELSLTALRDRLEGITIWWPPRRFLDRLNAFARVDAQPPNQLQREFSTALFGDNPYGRVATSEQVHAVRPNDIYRFRDSVLRPENGVLVIVGNLSLESAMSHAEDIMGGWSKLLERRPPQPVPSVVTPSAPQQVERDWPGSTQARVGLACLLEASNPEEVVVASMLGHLLRVRLFDQLREQLGASYSVSERSRILRGGTAVIEQDADVSYDQLAPAQKIIEDFVHTTPLFSAAELEYGLRSFAAGYNFRYSTTDQLARALFRNWVLGYGVQEFIDQPARFFDVSLARVNGAAQRCAQHAVRSLLGDWRQVSRALRPPGTAAAAGTRSAAPVLVPGRPPRAGAGAR